MIRKLIPALAAVVILVPSFLHAQAAATPEATAQEYFTAMSAGELDRMSSLMHPDALSSFRMMLQPVVDFASKSIENEPEIMQMFDGVETVAQLRKLDNAMFFRSFYAGLTALQPEIIETLKGAEIETIGSVKEGNDIAHVVYRMSTQMSPAISQTSVISLQRMKDGWGVLLTGEMETMAANLSRAMEQQH